MSLITSPASPLPPIPFGPGAATLIGPVVGILSMPVVPDFAAISRPALMFNDWTIGIAGILRSRRTGAGARCSKQSEEVTDRMRSASRDDWRSSSTTNAAACFELFLRVLRLTQFTDGA